MPESCDIVFALTGDVRRNSRAVRQLEALRDDGLQVTAITLGPEPNRESGIPGVRLLVLPTPSVRGPRFFLEMHRLFRQAAEPLAARAYHASDLFTLPAMRAAARRENVPLVYDARELYSGLGAAHKRPWASAFWYLLERANVRSADLVLTVNRPIADKLSKRYGLPSVQVMPNVPIQWHVEPARQLRRKAGLPGDVPVVLYQGFLKPGRGCEVLLEVARRVSSCAFVFLGEGVLRAKLQKIVSAYDLTSRVRFLEMVPPNRLLALTADATIGACLIEPLSESLRLSLPNKLFEYAAAGVPVLGSDLPEIERLIRTYDFGLTAPPDDVESVAAALRSMLASTERLNQWAKNTEQVRQHYDPAAILSDFRSAYRRLLAEGAT